MRVIILIACLLSSHIALASTPLKEITPQTFIAQAPSAEREAIVNFMIHQFDDWRAKGITQAQLNEVWDDNRTKRDLLMARFQIIDQKLYADCYNIRRPYFIILLNYLQNLLQTHKVQDVDFIFNVVDIMELPMPKVPSFMMSKDSNSPNEKDRFILPDAFLLDSDWNNLIPKIENKSSKTPWDKKEDKIFWRGALSGNNLNMETLDKFPRLSLNIISKLYPDLIDAKTTNRVSDATKSGLEAATVLDILFGKDYTNFTTMEDHLQYKYLASIDGATCAWKRVPGIMLSNSVLLKQETSFMEWFYPAMKPYVHYIPMDSRLTNIFQQLDWMKAHDDEVQQISKNAQNFVKNELMPEHIKDHMTIILNQYHALLQGSKLVPTLPPAEETIARANESSSKGLTYSERLVHGFRKFRYEFKKKILWW